MVGAAANPVSGALAAASKVTEGLDRSLGSVKETLVGQSARRLTRRRLPLCIRGAPVVKCV